MPETLWVLDCSLKKLGKSKRKLWEVFFTIWLFKDQRINQLIETMIISAGLQNIRFQNETWTKLTCDILIVKFDLITESTSGFLVLK